MANNHFMRRASSGQEPAKLSTASDTTTPRAPLHRPITYRNAQPRAMSIRPSRFIKAATPTTARAHDIPDSMQSFLHMFDQYSQKIYMEGYLLKDGQDKQTKCFAELCGSTLSMWDAEVQALTVMPQYFNVSDAMVCQQEQDQDQDQEQEHPTQDTKQKQNKPKKCMFLLHLNSKTQRLLQLEASDEATMRRWICAIRLACFEQKKLHQIYTQRLLLQHVDPLADVTTEAKWESFLQVRLPGTDWQKYWAVVTTKKKDKLFGKKAASHDGQLVLFETKRSKTAIITIQEISHAYIVYPESSQLIDKGSMMRIEGTVSRKGKETDHSHLLLMADSCQQTCIGLLAVFDAFKLHGRPHSLILDAMDTQALNFGETLAAEHKRLFLETEDATPSMDSQNISYKDIERVFVDALQNKLSKPRRPTPGMRANSLPLIAVACEDGHVRQRQRSVSDIHDYDASENELDDSQDQELRKEHMHRKFSRQVADSSDESDDEDDDVEEDEDEVDSDDEPIGKTKPHLSRTTSPAPLLSTDHLIPDFDFGNGFDVPRTPGAKRTQSSSGSSLLDTPDDEAAKSSKESPKQSAQSCLFGDFSLSTDFTKYLDQSLVSSPQRYTLSTNAKLSERESVDRQSSSGGISSSGSSQLDYGRQRRLSWDQQREGGYWDEEDSEIQRQHQHPYDVPEMDDYGHEFGPIIPPLGDHFAPQNSLLDTYLGDQLSAKEQIEYCRATGQPLIQVGSRKPRVPEAGLVGMISRREKDRREGNATRVSERVQQHQADKSMMEREKERRLLEQRQQQWMQHQMLLYANGYPPPTMPLMYPHPIHPFMPMSPMGPMGGLGPMGPMTPTSPMSPSAHYLMAGGMGYMTPPRASSPFRGGAISPNGPRSPSISSPISPSSRRSSRPLLDDMDDDTPTLSPLFQSNPMNRTMSPVFRKASPSVR